MGFTLKVTSKRNLRPFRKKEVNSSIDIIIEGNSRGKLKGVIHLQEGDNIYFINSSGNKVKSLNIWTLKKMKPGDIVSRSVKVFNNQASSAPPKEARVWFFGAIGNNPTVKSSQDRYKI